MRWKNNNNKKEEEMMPKALGQLRAEWLGINLAGDNNTKLNASQFSAHHL